MNPLSQLVKDWRAEATGPTMATSKAGREALMRCAFELESLVKATSALGKFRAGSGVGLPHGTVAWVVFDGTRYIRVWHPMAPTDEGAPQGNWWPLDNSFSGRFNESEVTHYAVIEVPDLPNDMLPPDNAVHLHRAKAAQQHVRKNDFAAVIGRNSTNTAYIGYSLVADPEAPGRPIVVYAQALTEEGLLLELADRVDAVLRTFFLDYRVVKL